MKRKIKTTNYDRTIIEVEVNIDVYNYDKENYWQEDWRNRKSKRQNSYEDYHEKSGLPHELWEESSEDTYFKRYEYEQLYKAINKLSKKQRRRIILRYFDGLTLQQIADIENTHKMSIKNSLNCAIKQIEKFLDS